MGGLETFSQLRWGKPSKVRVAVGVEVVDWPIYAYRGVMLDTSMNYFDVKGIPRMIGAMSANKLNVFHWYIVDLLSFPIVLPLILPPRALKGLRCSSLLLMSQIVEYSLQLRIIGLPEIDAPWLVLAYLEIVTCANMFWWPAWSERADRLGLESGTGHLNPLKPKTYQVGKNVIDVIIKMFPDSFYHAGADEIVPRAEKQIPQSCPTSSKTGPKSAPTNVCQFHTTVYPVAKSNCHVLGRCLTGCQHQGEHVGSSARARHLTDLEQWPP